MTPEQYVRKHLNLTARQEELFLCMGFKPDELSTVVYTAPDGDPVGIEVVPINIPLGTGPINRPRGHPASWMPFYRRRNQARRSRRAPPPSP